jgi:hypothetical protein
MVRTLHLAWSLIRIPHLAFSLFVFPLTIGICLVIVQLIATGVIVRASSLENSHLGSVEERSSRENSIVRRILYGSGDLRPDLKVCRWSFDPTTQEEVPPGPECAPDRLDVALRVSDPATFDVTHYKGIFSGQIDRLHVCQSCQPDVVITPKSGKDSTSRAYSAFGLAVLSLPLSHQDLIQKRMAVGKKLSHIMKLLGGVYFEIPEIEGGINTTAIRKTLPITMNIALLVIITLWLALRAHRKVLDYFAQNDVLLPLVAACGRSRFYSAIWLLTAARVFCFLGSSIPVLYFGLKGVVDKKSIFTLDTSISQLSVWLLAITTSLALATIMASISELKHRHHLLSIFYRYVPIAIALFGGVVWVATLLIDSGSMGMVRGIIAGLPVIGTAPLLLGPIINLPIVVMLPHALFAGILFVFMLRKNARWFAAHLEEI